MRAGPAARGVRHQAHEARHLERAGHVTDRRVSDHLGVDAGPPQIGDRRLVGRPQVAAFTPPERIDQAHVVHAHRALARTDRGIPDRVGIADQRIGNMGPRPPLDDRLRDPRDLCCSPSVEGVDPGPRIGMARGGAWHEADVRLRHPTMVDQHVAVHDRHLAQTKKFEHRPTGLEPGQKVLRRLERKARTAQHVGELALVELEGAARSLPAQPVVDAPVQGVGRDQVDSTLARIGGTRSRGPRPKPVGIAWRLQPERRQVAQQAEVLHVEVAEHPGHTLRMPPPQRQQPLDQPDGERAAVADVACKQQAITLVDEVEFVADPGQATGVDEIIDRAAASLEVGDDMRSCLTHATESVRSVAIRA